MACRGLVTDARGQILEDMSQDSNIGHSSLRNMRIKERHFKHVKMSRCCVTTLVKKEWRDVVRDLLCQTALSVTSYHSECGENTSM